MPQKPRYELVKFQCRSVTMERDGDRIVGESFGPEIVVYGPEGFVEAWARAELEIAAANEAASKPPPRRARRAAANAGG